MSDLLDIPAWPGYGSGVYVRSLALTTPAPGRVCLAMEDIVHAFQITMTHAEGRITGIEANWDRERYPHTSCAGAGLALPAMVGCPLGDDLFAVPRHGDARQHCTHMFDMLCVAVQHAHQGLEDRRYDVVVPDAVGGLQVATLSLNGRAVLVFEFDDDLVLHSPPACQGLSVLRGFMPWVRANVPVQAHTLYFIMQKALFVSRAQKLDLAAMVGQRATLSGPPAGTCFGSQPERVAHAVRMPSLRRLNAQTAGQVLAFFKPESPPFHSPQETPP